MSVCQSPECICICHKYYQSQHTCCISCYSAHVNKQETITIKKSLWDEMLEYKKKVDLLEKLMTQEICNSYHYRLEQIEKIYDDLPRSLHKQRETIVKINERIEKLENFITDVLQDFEKRMVKLEEKIKSMDKVLD
ncbi:MAG TPA: hypothetical protein VGW78_07705 [Candidatus Babeliales bacterium]|jgi:chromosome segregation ATPase|nr:hypothetical protein [Candidatus Babeliales bacterium]